MKSPFDLDAFFGSIVRELSSGVVLRQIQKFFLNQPNQFQVQEENSDLYMCEPWMMIGDRDEQVGTRYYLCRGYSFGEGVTPADSEVLQVILKKYFPADKVLLNGDALIFFGLPVPSTESTIGQEIQKSLNYLGQAKAQIQRDLSQISIMLEEKVSCQTAMAP